PNAEIWPPLILLIEPFSGNDPQETRIKMSPNKNPK
ncbi:MAG: hypothetical protein ACI9FU_002374, partial [Granulosicoccus sp.]